jgi:hypothetical protein
MESRTKTWRAANRISFSEAITHFAVLIFENFLTNAIYHYSNRLNFAIILIVLLLLAAFFITLLPAVRTTLRHALRLARRTLFMRRPAAEDHLSFTGTNIALKKTERSKASQNVLYSAMDYRSALCIL